MNPAQLLENYWLTLMVVGVVGVILSLTWGWSKREAERTETYIQDEPVIQPSEDEIAIAKQDTWAVADYRRIDQILASWGFYRLNSCQIVDARYMPEMSHTSRLFDIKKPIFKYSSEELQTLGKTSRNAMRQRVFQSRKRHQTHIAKMDAEVLA